GRRRVTIQVGVDVEELTTELYGGDVFEPKDLAIVCGSKDDVLVLLGLVVSTLIREDVLERLRLLAGRLPEPTGSSDDALLVNRLHHVFGRDFVRAHLVRIEPNAHGVLARSDDASLSDSVD